MGEYEPRDSRIVTDNPSKTPIEPERTGPQEGTTRPAGNNEATRSDSSDIRKVDEDERWQVEKGETQ